MGNSSNRRSNIELLRIFAALGIVVLHYNNANIGGGFTAAADGSIDQFVMICFESLFICAVDLFILISGYFLRDSKKSDLLKPVKLLAMYLIFETAFYLIKELPKDEPFLLKRFFCYYAPSYWFIFVYIALYLISPFISVMWNNLSKKAKKTLLMISALLFSVLPIFWESVTLMSDKCIWDGDSISFYGLLQGTSPIGIFGSGAGYTIVNFVLLYLIGCFIKDLEEENIRFKNSVLCILLLINVAAIVGWTYAEFHFTGTVIFATTAWNYENPFVISEAVIVFLIFKNMRIRNNKVINTLALAAFPTYLIHINIMGYFKIPEFVKQGTAVFILHLFGTVLLNYLICFVVFKIYDLITCPLYRYISDKWQKHRFIEAP